jgi:integrase
MARRPRRSWGKIHQQRSGRFQASYNGPDLARHTAPATFTKSMDAEHWLAEERRLIERDAWTPPKMRAAEKHARAKILETYAKEWVEYRDLKPRTRQGYLELLAGPIKPLGRLALGNISSETVRAWHAGMGKDTPRRKSHAYALLHAIMATAVTDGWIAANPCNIPRAMNPPTKRAAVILDVNEVAKIANAIQPEKLKCLVLVSAWCGLRWGEVTELRRRDIDAACEVIIVSRGVTHRKGQCEIDTPKSGKGRPVVVPPHIREDLKEHMERFVAEDPEALVFPAARGCHLNDRVFRDYFAEALKSVGREGVRIHDLRHFAGTQAARVGNLVETMQRLGHSTAKASLIYQAVVSGRDRELADALSKLAAVKPAADDAEGAEKTG